jgi:hypothetical protein
MESPEVVACIFALFWHYHTIATPVTLYLAGHDVARKPLAAAQTQAVALD